MARAELQFIDRAEVVQLIGPPGTGKSHLSLALGVEAVKAQRSVYFADIIATLATAEREGTLRERIRFLSLRAADRRRDWLPASHIGRRQSLLPVGQRPLRKGRHHHDVQSGFCRVGRYLWRRLGRNSNAGPTSPPCRRVPNRGFELPLASARRPCPGIHPDKGKPPTITHSADTQTSRTAAKPWRDRSRDGLITMPPKWGIYLGAFGENPTGLNMRRCSSGCAMPARSSQAGPTTTTPSGFTRGGATSNRRRKPRSSPQRSIRARRRITKAGSNRRWMRVRRQINPGSGATL